MPGGGGTCGREPGSSLTPTVLEAQRGPEFKGHSVPHQTPPRLDLCRLSRLPGARRLQLVISRGCRSSVLTEPQPDRPHGRLFSLLFFLFSTVITRLCRAERLGCLKLIAREVFSANQLFVWCCCSVLERMRFNCNTCLLCTSLHIGVDSPRLSELLSEPSRCFFRAFKWFVPSVRHTLSVILCLLPYPEIRCGVPFKCRPNCHNRNGKRCFYCACLQDTAL